MLGLRCSFCPTCLGVLCVSFVRSVTHVVPDTYTKKQIPDSRCLKKTFNIPPFQITRGEMKLKYVHGNPRKVKPAIDLSQEFEEDINIGV